MVLRLMEENRPLDEIVFYDTGMEFQAIYIIAEKLKSLAESKGIVFRGFVHNRGWTSPP